MKKNPHRPLTERPVKQPMATTIRYLAATDLAQIQGGRDYWAEPGKIDSLTLYRPSKQPAPPTIRPVSATDLAQIQGGRDYWKEPGKIDYPN